MADDVAVAEDEVADVGGEEEGAPLPEARTPLLLTADEHPRIVREAIGLIAKELFQKGGELVRVNPAINGHKIEPVNDAVVDMLLNENILFQKTEMRGRGENRRAEVISCAAPPWLSNQICKLQRWSTVRHLETLTYAPYLRADGTVGGLTAGYDKSARCMSVSSAKWTPVAESPSDADAHAALATLADLVAEFPFADRSGLSVFLAAVLTIVGRRAIHGQVPLTLINASTPGSGKTLLAKTIAFIADGQMPSMDSAGDNEEFRKKATAKLQGDKITWVLDNCVGELGGEAMDRLLTAPVWSDRLLLTNKEVVARNELVIIATGNNARVRGETARRSIVAAIQPRCERPEERSFKRPNLLNYVREHHAELIHAALTILRWHIAKGQPEYSHAIYVDADANEHRTPIRPFGSFEEWSKLVRHAVIGLGLPDPYQSGDGIRKVDELGAQRRAFLEALAAWDFNWEGTCKSLVQKLYSEGLERTPEVISLRAAIENWVGEKDVKGGIPSSATLGYRVRDMKERIYARLTLSWVRHDVDGAVYKLVSRQPGAEDQGGGGASSPASSG
jgi:hypothetical protein